MPCYEQSKIQREVPDEEHPFPHRCGGGPALPNHGFPLGQVLGQAFYGLVFVFSHTHISPSERIGRA